MSNRVSRGVFKRDADGFSPLTNAGMSRTTKREIHQRGNDKFRITLRVPPAKQFLGHRTMPECLTHQAEMSATTIDECLDEGAQFIDFERFFAMI